MSLVDKFVFFFEIPCDTYKVYLSDLLSKII